MTSTESQPSPAPALEVMAAADKDIGGREHDEDGFLLRPDLALFAVADGAGGENAGNVASSIALASLARHFEATQKSARTTQTFDRLGLPLLARRLSAGIHRASREVLEIARSADRYRGMGTTMVALAPDLETAVLHVAHVGDSRCYRLRAGRLELLTQDHSLAQDVLELSPEIDEDKAAKLPQNVITRALGMSETVRVSVRSFDLALGDVFVLCTDGLTDVLSDEEIAETLLTTNSVRGQVSALLGRAKAAPADDNVAIAVVRFDALPGALAVPKRHATRPHPTRPPSGAPPRATLPGDSWHDPEIVVLENEPDDDEPALHIVPASVPPGMLDALHDVVLPRPRPRKRFPRPEPEGEPRARADEDAQDAEPPALTLVDDDDD
ncbi:PP2C family protein-serine/threonine phosphatase [Sandaracinus amylolyticus]|uniref:PP2C family protein-serine/threonine phosphatase n=1 Tax=Sandaracinus amylolyticus TaxID=927083 RepID=UPI001F3CBDBB|nr:protein phosphatase 2C domain-containing protein [Sandaracinus amylolyticus]UJR81615.1 Serine/threonine phosphatase PrpC, regulation of stationary phase [Sandaracinus amylolyticus]